MRSIQAKLLSILESRLGKQYKGYRWFPIPLLLSSEREISSILSISLAEARDLINDIRSEFKDPVDIVNTKEIVDIEESLHCTRVATNLGAIDTILGGGFKCGHVYQVFGPSMSGKTEFAYLSIVSFLHHPFDKKANVAVIDSEHSFRPERLMQYSNGTIDLNKVIVATCYSTPHLTTLLDTVDSMMQRGIFIPLLVVDSVMPASFQLYQDEPQKRQKMLFDISARLWAMSREHGTCVLFTNHAAVDLAMPASSNALLGCSDHVIYLKKNEFDASIETRLIKNVDGPEQDARFRIGPDGIKG